LKQVYVGFISEFTALAQLCPIFFQMNLDGKNGFIGCEHYAPGESHRFVTINRDIEEKSLIELFQNKGQFTSFVNVVTATCARVLPPRQGGKGERVCRALI
jgi:hypothetical protein